MSVEQVDPAAAMAAHQSGGRHGWDCVVCNDGYDIPWPCEPYRLAWALIAERAKVATATAIIGVLRSALKRRLALLTAERAKVTRVQALADGADEASASSLCRMIDGSPFSVRLDTEDIRAALADQPKP